jgi:N-acetylglucosaminyldiphosphoundecaprenol N-acetyl-beta-D-mannosaminyltransferase
MQRCGLEWLFRLVCEPRRLWRRYAFNNTAFMLSILPQLMGLKNHSMEK